MITPILTRFEVGNVASGVKEHKCLLGNSVRFFDTLRTVPLYMGKEVKNKGGFFHLVYSEYIERLETTKNRKHFIFFFLIKRNKNQDRTECVLWTNGKR